MQQPSYNWPMLSGSSSGIFYEPTHHNIVYFICYQAGRRAIPGSWPAFSAQKNTLITTAVWENADKKLHHSCRGKHVDVSILSRLFQFDLMGPILKSLSSKAHSSLESFHFENKMCHKLLHVSSQWHLWEKLINCRFHTSRAQRISTGWVYKLPFKVNGWQKHPDDCLWHIHTMPSHIYILRTCAPCFGHVIKKMQLLIISIFVPNFPSMSECFSLSCLLLMEQIV